MTARWLGLVPIDRIVDHKNSAPIIMPRGNFILNAEAVADFPGMQFNVDEIGINPNIDIDAKQPWSIAIFGEKSSLREILTPIHERYGASIYLAEGEPSLSHVYDMARRAVDDCQSLALFTLTDCDPAGHQMAISMARKLQALKDGFIPSLEYKVIAVALTPQQAIDFDLPSTPLRPKEKRSAKWREAFGRDQTEIDAMIALHEDELSAMITDAVRPYYDDTLAERFVEAKSQWREAAREAIDGEVGTEIKSLREEARNRLGSYNSIMAELEEKFGAVNRNMRLPDFRFPKADIPAPSDDGVFVSSRWGWLRQTKTLKDRKAYIDAAADEAA